MTESQVQPEQTLPIVVTVYEEEGDASMGIFSRSDGEVALREVPVKVLRENLMRTVAGLRSIFDELAEDTSALKVREAQVSFEVSASGGINLVGTTEVKGTGAITLIFKE